MKPRPKPKEATCPLWMMTFGDCMSLLVTFFVMLIAFTNMEKEQLMDMIGAMKGALGVTPERADLTSHLLPKPIPPISAAERIRGRSDDRRWLSVEEMSVVVPRMHMASRRFGSPTVGVFDRVYVIRMFDEGMAFIIHTETIFKEGTAEMLPDFEEIWEQIGSFAKTVQNEIRIVAVAPENMAVHSENSLTAWGLGVERAQAAKGAMKQGGKLEEYRFSTGVYVTKSGESPPEAGNMLPDDRIEIILVGRREMHDLSPEEMVIRNRWK